MTALTVGLEMVVDAVRKALQMGADSGVELFADHGVLELPSLVRGSRRQ